jgi:4-hydroxysphinganine ceramide fatty acyl 2-hydroxylase
MATVKAKGTAKLFDNKILEALTRTNPLVVLAVYFPLSAFLVWFFVRNFHPTGLSVVGLFFGGLFTWTFFEYILHRYIFHFINDTEWAKKFHFFVHGVHHDYPKDKDRLVMPPVASLGVAVIFFLLFQLFLGSASLVFFSGFLIGYLCYDMIHYILHAFRPPHNFLKFLWEYHNIHHFRHPEKAYGVSTPIWDVVFGTYPPKIVKKKSEAGQ